MAEVEKIWIIYDYSKNGDLKYDKWLLYLKDVTVPSLTLTDKEVMGIFK